MLFVTIHRSHSWGPKVHGASKLMIGGLFPLLRRRC